MEKCKMIEAGTDSHDRIVRLKAMNKKRRVKICILPVIKNPDQKVEYLADFTGYPFSDPPSYCSGGSPMALNMTEAKPIGSRNLGMTGTWITRPEKTVLVWDPNRKCKVRVDARLAELAKCLLQQFDILNCFRTTNRQVGLVFGSQRGGTVFGALTCEEFAAKQEDGWNSLLELGGKHWGNCPAEEGWLFTIGFPENAINKVIRLLKRYNAWEGVALAMVRHDAVGACGELPQSLPGTVAAKVARKSGKKAVEAA